MAIMPFSVPANLATQDAARPGYDMLAARLLHAELLTANELPVVELLNRAGWPGNRDDFAFGNFEAIRQARDSGYDLLLLGQIAELSTPEAFTAYTKIIDVDSNTTVWSARYDIHSNRKNWQYLGANVAATRRRPDQFAFTPMLEKLAACVRHTVISNQE